jgi:hypothetical protein
MKVCLVGIFLGLSLPIWAQQQDSIPPAPSEQVRMVFMDSVKMARKNRLPVPKRALLYSFALPGAGQVYNGRWWKAPFAIGAVGTAVYFVQSNTNLYRDLKEALELELQGKMHQFSKFNLGVNGLRANRDKYDRYRQLSYVAVVATYGLVAVEAFVDAHLQNFDISEDLSWKIKPTFQQAPQFGGGPGLGIVFLFK